MGGAPLRARLTRSYLTVRRGLTKKTQAQLANDRAVLAAEKATLEQETAALVQRTRQFEARQGQFKQQMQELLASA